VTAPAVESHVRPPSPPAPVVHRVTAPVVVSGLISGAALATGIVFSVVAMGKHDSYVKKPDSDVALAGEQASFMADISFGMAALFGLAAIALYVLPDEQSTPHATNSAPPTVARPRKAPWVRSAITGEVLRF
jgi:hypothetical protein